MKIILMITLFLCLITGAAMVEPQRRDSSEIETFPEFAKSESLRALQSDNVAKRGSKKNYKNLLSTISCRYLKKKGYLKNIPALQKLCFKAYCRDVLSKKSCNIVKKRKGCIRDSSLSLVYCKYTCNTCQCKKRPLGMESGAIPDSSITASSIYSSHYRPSSARLKNTNKRKGYGWAAKTNVVGQWIQVDLRKTTRITGVATQGRIVNGEWVKSYSLQYSNDGKTFTHYQGGKIFQGNTDYKTVVKNELVTPIVARYIRLLPKTWHSHITMRMELYGCK